MCIVAGSMEELRTTTTSMYETNILLPTVIQMGQSPYGSLSIGIGASPTGPVLAGPLFLSVI